MTDESYKSTLWQSPLVAVVVGAILSLFAAGIVALASIAVSNNTAITSLQKQMDERQQAGTRSYFKTQEDLKALQDRQTHEFEKLEPRLLVLENVATELKTHLNRLDEIIGKTETFGYRLENLENSRDEYNKYFQSLIADETK